jgi:hypothetical protein
LNENNRFTIFSAEELIVIKNGGKIFLRHGNSRVK